MVEQYKDPWADVANQAVGALYKYYLSKPNPADLQRAQMENQLLDAKIRGEEAQLKNAELAFNKGQFDFNQSRQNSQFADQFRGAFDKLPQLGAEKHLMPGQYGPNPPVTQQDRNSQIAGLFEQFAPRLGKDTVEAARDALGTAGAMRFEDPIQRQLAIDEKATSYENMMPGYTLSPGQIRFGAGNEQLAAAPFKSGGGSYIQQPDGTIISIDGGAPPDLTNAVKTDLQTKDIAFDTYRSFSQKFRNDIMSNPGSVGTRGNAARIVDGLLGQVNQFAPGSQLEGQMKSVVTNLTGQFTDPTTGQIMNNDLYAATSTAALLPFVAAEAIVGQGGRSLSNEDRDLVREAIGGPEDWLATPDKIIARLDNLDVLVENLRMKYQGRQIGQRPFTPPTGNDPLTLQGGGIVKWTVDQNGNPVPMRGQ